MMVITTTVDLVILKNKFVSEICEYDAEIGLHLF